MNDLVEQIAEVCHEANRVYCLSIGDHSQPRWDDAPDWQRESAVQGVENIVEGSVKAPGETHVSWLASKKADGWVYGEVKDAEAKTHPCMVEYKDLPVEQQKKDALFFGIASQFCG